MARRDNAEVQYDEYVHLRANHPAWSLLRSNNVALVLSFLGRVFVDENASGLPAATLADLLDDELYALNERLGGDTFPKPALAYLDDWASPERAWLRKYYPTGSDEAHYDLSPAVEKALLWVGDLRSRDFVGTESRLNIVFELLRQMVFGADDNPEQRLADLRRRRAELDDEIARAERGDVALLDAVGQRDRYQQFSRMARELLADFREVEDNFRQLDRQLREQIAGWSGSKGGLLDDVLQSRSSIAESDQGRSFQAFYDFLLSHQKQAELADLLERLQQIGHLPDQDRRMTRIHFDWIDAAERTQATVRMLSEQLRRFLDDQVWLENRRVFDLLRSIEAQTLRFRSVPDPGIHMELDDMAATIGLPCERPLYRRSKTSLIDSDSVQPGSADFDSSALHAQLFVDRDELVRTVRTSLHHHSQIDLSNILAGLPLEQGLAELITYLSLSDPTFSVIFDEQRRDRIEWSDDDVRRVAELPHVTFARGRSESR